MECVADHHGDVFVVDTVIVDRRLEEMAIVFEPAPAVSRRVSAGRRGGLLLYHFGKFSVGPRGMVKSGFFRFTVGSKRRTWRLVKIAE